MNTCIHSQPACEGCEAEGALVLPDDVSRIVTMYGHPDRDVASEARASDPGGESRTLEYYRARLLYTFLPENGGTTVGAMRWKLLMVSDTASLQSLSPWAAAQRFYSRQS